MSFIVSGLRSSNKTVPDTTLLSIMAEIFKGHLLLKLTIKVEDLQNIVNIVQKYSDMSLKKRSVIGIHTEDKSVSLQNEIVQLKFIDVFQVIENKLDVKGFSFDIKSIAK